MPFFNKKILIVDDDSSIREIFSLMLEMEGFIVSQAEHGKQAIDILNTLTSEEYPNCILLDLMMPVMSGSEFLSLMKVDYSNSFEKIPVIVCSGYGECIKTKQIVATLVKPVDLTALFQTIEKAINSEFQVN